jgi:4-diphosphocytidyl-2-C-methyl-D-erythritol kinase
MSINAFAPAKINLSLQITGKRSDGYHLLHSFVTFAKDIGDCITVEPSDQLKLSLTGRFSTNLPDSTTGDEKSHSGNLVMRAAYLLADMAGIEAKAHITLEKNLPVSSGIGGGSSDAAAAIKALCTLWKITPDQKLLSNAMLNLGADLPACMAQKTIIMEGIGEKIDFYKGLPQLPVLLINPLIACPTQHVFKNFKGCFTPPVKFPDAFDSPQDFCNFANAHLHNDLESAAIQAVPKIKEVLSALRHSNNCLYTGLSGSGATCYAIYPTPDDAEHAQRQVEAIHKQWWIKSGILGDKI